MKKIIFSLSVIFILISNANARESIDNLYSQMKRLQNDVTDLQKYIYKSDSKNLAQYEVDEGNLPRMESEIIRLNEEVQNLNGKIEEISHMMDVLAKKFDKTTQDIDYRMINIENDKNSLDIDKPLTNNNLRKNSNIPVSNMVISDDGPIDILSSKFENNNETINIVPFPKKITNKEEEKELKKLNIVMEHPSKDLFNQAFKYMRQSKYDEAGSKLLEFISKSKDEEELGKAYYWLGETFYVQESYKRAAMYFLKGYKNYPKSSKVSNNLFKLADSLGKLGKKDEKCAALEKLLQEFPNDNKDVLIDTQEEIKSSC